MMVIDASEEFETYDNEIDRVATALNRPNFWVTDLKKVAARAEFY
jgi:hypothetical protein